MDQETTGRKPKRRADWVPAPHREPEPHKGIKFYRLSEVQEEEIRWLWFPYIPAGKVTLLEGDPGMGKSWITCKIAADVSSGTPMPGQKVALPPQKVLMISGEDGLGDTVKPRIRTLGGNMENIYVTDEHFVLDPQGISDLEDMMKQTAATIVFIDPIVAYMGAKIDMHRANEVRGLMMSLYEAARNTGAAIIAVRHLRKAGGSNAKYNGIGSIDFTAAVRSGLQVGETKGGTRFLRHFKSNLAAEGSALAYSLVDNHFEWGGILEDDAVEKTSVSVRPLSHAQDFLRDVLRDGPVAASTMSELATRAGLKERTLNNAKKGVAHSEKHGDTWVWVLDARGSIDAPSRPIAERQLGDIGSGPVSPAGNGLPTGQALDPEILAAAEARLKAMRGVS